MLGSRMSNQDEDEVEDELDALEQEVIGNKATNITVLPEAPTTNMPDGDGLISQIDQRKAWSRTRKESVQAAEAMLA